MHEALFIYSCLRWISPALFRHPVFERCPSVVLSLLQNNSRYFFPPEFCHRQFLLRCCLWRPPSSCAFRANLVDPITLRLLSKHADKNTMVCPYLHIQYSTSRRLTDPSELKRGEIGNANAGIIFQASFILRSWDFHISNKGDMRGQTYLCGRI